MGLLAAAGTLPTALFSLPAGVWVDRLPRRPILIVTDLGRTIVLATIPLAFVLGALGMPQLYIVAFLCGTLSVFFVVAYIGPISRHSSARQASWTRTDA
jgi:MFS family permease